jgi:ABC-type transporter Mla MlaB component
MSEALQVRVVRASGVIVVDVHGELDAETAAAVENAVEGAALFDADVIIVDTSALTFVDSAGRRALNHACRRAEAIFVPGPVIERFDRLLGRALLRRDHVPSFGFGVDKRVA